MILNAKVCIWEGRSLYGRMSFPSTSLLLCLWLSPAIAYKLPLLDGTLLTHHETVQKPNNSPFGINYKWEWQSQNRMDDGTLVLSRLRREIIDKKSNKEDVTPDAKIVPKVKPTEQALDELHDTTPYILEASSVALTKAKSLALLNEDETTPVTDQEQTTPTELELVEDKTTQVSKSVTQSETLVTELTLDRTKSEELSVLTSTTVNQAHSTAIQETSAQQASTNDELLEDITSRSSPEAPKTSPTSTPVVLHDLTTGHDATIVWFSTSFGSSAKPAAVTHISTSSEDQVNTQSLMRQCMLTILILAVVCTIFIISTIALAAKLSTMKQKNKLRHPATYTEMRCISSLMPDSDQQNKPHPKRLKTFAANMEESDGDNTTLHSFLPDH